MCVPLAELSPVTMSSPRPCPPLPVAELGAFLQAGSCSFHRCYATFPAGVPQLFCLLQTVSPADLCAALAAVRRSFPAPAPAPGLAPAEACMHAIYTALRRFWHFSKVSEQLDDGLVAFLRRIVVDEDEPGMPAAHSDWWTPQDSSEEARSMQSLFRGVRARPAVVCLLRHLQDNAYHRFLEAYDGTQWAPYGQASCPGNLFCDERRYPAPPPNMAPSVAALTTLVVAGIGAPEHCHRTFPTAIPLVLQRLQPLAHSRRQPLAHSRLPPPSLQHALHTCGRDALRPVYALLAWLWHLSKVADRASLDHFVAAHIVPTLAWWHNDLGDEHRLAVAHKMVDDNNYQAVCELPCVVQLLRHLRKHNYHCFLQAYSGVETAPYGL